MDSLLTPFGEVTGLRPPGAVAVERPAARQHIAVIAAGPERRACVADAVSPAVPRWRREAAQLTARDSPRFLTRPRRCRGGDSETRAEPLTPPVSKGAR
jgi:hypothetical protein